jgi:uncharacterized protein (TIGR03546 family)
MVALKILSKLFKALRSNQSPRELAWGFVLGMILGLTPLWNLHNLVIIILIIVLRVNAAMSIAGFLLFSLFAFFFDPLFHSFGYWLLTDVSWLQPMWMSFATTPVLAFSNYNNTLVLGSFVVSLFLIAPIYFLARQGVVQYRENLESRVQKFKLVQIVTGSKLYKLFQKFSHLGD